MTERRFFGLLSDGRRAGLYRLESESGTWLTLTDYGARIVQLCVPDRCGNIADVVLGYDSAAKYEACEDYFGATCGRVSNRIASARFTLGGESFSLSANDGPNTLHGGFSGLTRVLWDAAPVENGVRFSFVSPDGAEGFPGRVAVSCTYTLDACGCVEIAYSAVSDRDTPLSLTNHTYFNLSGHDAGGCTAGGIEDHLLQLDADYFTPVDDALLPTGELRAVSGTPFDFTIPHRIGERIADGDDQLQRGAGYDHNFVLSQDQRGQMHHAAMLHDPASGRRLDICTTMPGIQIYTANMLSPRVGKGGAVYARRGAICLEPQHFPNSVNIPAFPSPLLCAGEPYAQRIHLQFSCPV